MAPVQDKNCVLTLRTTRSCPLRCEASSSALFFLRCFPLFFSPVVLEDSIVIITDVPRSSWSCCRGGRLPRGRRARRSERVSLAPLAAPPLPSGSGVLPFSHLSPPCLGPTWPSQSPSGWLGAPRPL